MHAFATTCASPRVPRGSARLAPGLPTRSARALRHAPVFSDRCALQSRVGLLLLACLLACAPQHIRAQTLPSRLDALFDAPRYENAWWAARIVDLTDGTVVYERNARRSFIPASNTKLYTTAAALEQLGPDYRYQTVLYADGPVANGVLRGNLIVRGSGDPSIGGRFTDGDRTAVFRAWADSLRAAGITRIEGDLIGDDDVFDDVPLGYGWSWDDETYWYGAEISGLSFNDNCVDVTIAPTTPGAPARIFWEPDSTDYVRVVNQTLTLPADSSLDEGYERLRGTNILRLYSRVPADRPDTESLTVNNPTRYFVHVLRETLLRQGIAVQGRPVDVDDLSIKPDYEDDALLRVATHLSPPLARIVEVINKESQNLYAEQLLRTLGAERAASDSLSLPGSAERGLAAVMETLVRAGIDTSRVQLVDGSGLSRLNLVTAEMTSRLLTYLWHHPDPAVREAFLGSLPVGGEDGTLEYRFRDTPVRGRVRAKTGTVGNVSTLSGYVTSTDGTPYAFVLMANHYTTKTRDVRATLDEAVRLLVDPAPLPTRRP
ncbi:MAG: peptidase M15 [Rhodothermaceae bacterium]|nr:MAG: peptidase M15 [Rhodothermaceae bacterium]